MGSEPPAQEARALSATERELLDLLLAVDAPGVEMYRVQAVVARAVPNCVCGCGSIALVLPADAPVGPTDLPTVVSDAEVLLPDGQCGSLILFQADGRLAHLEIASYFDPMQMPDPQFVTLPPG